MQDQTNQGLDMNDDAALVMHIGAGDKKALGILVEKYKKLAYQTALGLVGNKDDAFDISQEAFLRVYRSAKTYDRKQPFLPWFYTIVANLSRTWLRRRSRRENRMVDLDDTSFLMVTEDTPETEYWANEQVRKLRGALMKLSFEDREIITLQHFRAMSYDEIAKLLEIPKGTVMSRLYYARKRLAKLMREDAR
ncbi:sigma-70 family RNA polymerase sigma factor [candidate division GN15 bacterium]|nr:sigma-70 family RNA polymerase sigma factor [candidate division GN15 bacterium]